MSELIQQGLILMALGMGTVFGFLVLLILCTSLMTYVVRRYSQPEVVAQVGAGRGNKNAQMEQIAVVAAAARAAHQR